MHHFFYRTTRRALPLLVALVALLGTTTTVRAQALRFSNYREVKVPDYATVRWGSFSAYSDLTFSQSIGARYSDSDGAGIDYIRNNERGAIKDDGVEIPILSQFSMRNYLIVSERTDVEFAITVGYDYYPLETQDDYFYLDFADQGVEVDLTTEIRFSEYHRMRLYDRFSYRTDFVDYRGISDNYGGNKYERISNELGVDYDWLISKLQNLGLKLARVDELPLSESYPGYDLNEHYGYIEEIVYQQRLSPSARWDVGAEFSQTFYTVEPRTEDVYFYELFTGGALVLPKRYTLDGRVGLRWSDTLREGEETLRDDGQLTLGLGLAGQISETRSHRLQYDRSQDTGFVDSGIYNTDNLRYDYNWSGSRFPGRIETGISKSTPVGDSTFGGYINWLSKLDLRHDLTRLTALYFRTSYEMRFNDDPTIELPDLPEVTSDYDTWITRIGVVVPLTRTINWDSYYEYSVRRSDDDRLAYTRNLVASFISWSHHF
jgi:hypothetical protein